MSLQNTIIDQVSSIEASELLVRIRGLANWSKTSFSSHNENERMDKNVGTTRYSTFKCQYKCL